MFVRTAASSVVLSCLCLWILPCYPKPNGKTPQKVTTAKPRMISAKSAVIPQVSPAQIWRQHYLQEDRYRLGSIWKVVSTELDTYYHRPFCANMLRQDAGIVLGFASHSDAVEAGYMACGLCRPPVPPKAFTPTPEQQRDITRSHELANQITEADYEMFFSIMASPGRLTPAQQMFRGTRKFQILWSQGQRDFQQRAIQIANQPPPPKINVQVRIRR